MRATSLPGCSEGIGLENGLWCSGMGCAMCSYDHDYGGLKRALEWGPGGILSGGGNQPGAF